MGCKPNVSYGSSDSKPRPFDDSDSSFGNQIGTFDAKFE